MKEELNGFLLLTYNQRDWVEIQLFMQRKQLKRLIPEPEHPIRQLCYKMTQSKRFDIMVFIIIFLNTIILALKYPTQSSSFQNIVSVFDNIFLAIFHIEALIKICAWGLFYFKDNWNKLPF
jgi:hypothetical protein